jgi:hypothetical protein
MLKHDAQGFLVGDPIDMGRALDTLTSIRDDARSILRALNAPQRQSGNAPRAPAIPNNGSTGAPRRDVQAAAIVGQAVEAVASQAAQQAAAKPVAREGHTATVPRFNDIAKPVARGYELPTGNEQKRQEGLLRRIYSSLTGFRKEETVFNKAAKKSLKAIEDKPEGGGNGGGGGFGMLFGGLGAALASIPGVSGVGALLGSAGKAVMGAGRGLRGLGKGLFKRIPILGALLTAGVAAADILDTEGNSTLTRGQKDARTGKAVGGAAGGIGGMLAGAKLGAVMGAAGGPIGMAIGGVVGGVAGAFFGDQAGQIIGEKVGGWVNDLRAADIPGKIEAAWTEVKVTALGTWDWMKSGWDKSLSVFNDVFRTAGDAWGRAVDKVTAAFGTLGDFIDRTHETLKSLPVVGKALETVEAAARKVGNLATAAKGKAIELAGNAADAVKSTAGAAWEGAQGAASKVGRAVINAVTPTGLRDSIAARRAAETAGQPASSSNWRDTKRYLLEAANQTGVDAGMLAKIARLESGFNPKAKSNKSSAHGYGQFIDATWTDMINRHGPKYGIAGAGTLTKAQAAKYRGDKAIQAAMLAEFTRENIERGRMSGGTDDDANTYAFHNLGSGDAPNLLSGMKQNPSMTVREALLQGAKTAKDRARIERVIANNRGFFGDGSVTAAEAYSRMGQHMRRGDAYAADIRQSPPSLSPSVAAPAMPSVVSSTSMRSLPSLPRAQSVPETPPIVVPLSSGGTDRPIQVSIPRPEAGQDVRDRGIAHIVTGGLSGD